MFLPSGRPGAVTFRRQVACRRYLRLAVRERLHLFAWSDVAAFTSGCPGPVAFSCQVGYLWYLRSVSVDRLHLFAWSDAGGVCRRSVAFCRASIVSRLTIGVCGWPSKRSPAVFSGERLWLHGRTSQRISAFVSLTACRLDCRFFTKIRMYGRRRGMILNFKENLIQ